jgi:ABC-2 type transport system ATP-binding protein
MNALTQTRAGDPAVAAGVALAISDVSHSYGPRKALDRVSFAVAEGSFTVLLGLNGAGKSTLFALVTRLFDTRQGGISIFGFEVARDPGEALRRLGVVFQSRTLDLDLSIMQNLTYHAALHGIGGAEARARAASVMARVGMGDRAHDKSRDLSGGQMRRVEIARALLHQPRLLLLDEPTVGLDINARAEVLGHVRRLVDEDRIGVLWATHLIDEIRAGDDVVVLHKGRVLDSGPVEAVVARAGVGDIRAAFSKLTGGPPRDEDTAP